MEKLKPCPHCGKIDAIELTDCVEAEGCQNFENCGREPYVCVVCNANKGGCGAAGGYAPSEEEAAEKWNRRAAPENDDTALKAQYDEINRYNISCTKKIDELLAEKVAAPENKPLTLDQLREMDGEPVFVASPGAEEYGHWVIVAGVDDSDGDKTLYCNGDFTCRNYGKTWFAYARRPEAAK